MAMLRFAVPVLLGALVVGIIAVSGAFVGVVAAGPSNPTDGERAGESAVFAAADFDAHSALSDDQPTLDTIEYEFVGESENRVIVEGYRSGHLGQFFDVRVGESIRIPVRVTNTGETPATYELPLLIDGDAVDVKTGELGAGEETVVEPGFRYVPESEGARELPVYTTLELAGWETMVGVYGRDAMVLKTIEVSESTVEVGEEVTVTATIENGASPSVETVEIWNWGDVIHTATVSLAAGESTTVETSYTIEEIPGGHFSVSGNLVTGGVARVTVNDSSVDINDSEFDVNESDLDFNRSDVDVNGSDRNVSGPDVDVNESDFDINDSDVVVNESELDVNESAVNVSADVDANGSDWEPDSDAAADSTDGDGAGLGRLGAVSGILVAVALLSGRFSLWS